MSKDMIASIFGILTFLFLFLFLGMTMGWKQAILVYALTAVTVALIFVGCKLFLE